MAEDKRISELDDGGFAQEGDYFPVVRGDDNVKVQLPEFGSRMGTFFSQSPANLEIPLVASARYAFEVTGLYGLKTAAGTLALTIAVNGTPVPGLSAVAVTTAARDVAASATVVGIGDRLTAVVAAVASASGLEFTLY